MRTLRRDIAQYNKEDEELDETLEETGWKLVHGDIFRPPAQSTILCALIGSGIQIGLMGMITIVVAMFGMLSPSARGSLITGLIFKHFNITLITEPFSLLLSLHVHGHFLGLFRRSPLQNGSRTKLERCGDLDFAAVPRRSLWHVLLVEFFHLGPEIIRCGAIYHHDRHSMHVDGRLAATCHHGLLLRI